MSAAFRAPLWACVLTGAAVAAFIAAAAWQFERGRTKESLRATLGVRVEAGESLTLASHPPTGLGLRRARAAGTYWRDRQLLADGQSHEQQPGRHVWTPLRLRDGAIVLVDRGWVPLTSSGIAAPGGEVTVTGFWRALPEPGLRLTAAENCPARKEFPALVIYPTHADIECLLGTPVLGGLLLLDPELPGGFVRAWTDFGFPPERHYAYAFQWLALAVASVFVFIVVNRKQA